jgi:hypothetical protein
MCAFPSGDKNFAAFITMLVVSLGTACANGPKTESFNSLLAVTSTLSLMFAKVTKLSKL